MKTMTAQQPTAPNTIPLTRLVLALSAATTTLLLAWVLYYSRFGIDFSDEGFYLYSIANPSAYTINIPPSLFGFVYHWLYALVDGDIALIRMVNIAVTMALGWALSFLLVRRLWDWPEATPVLPVAVLSAGLSSLALVNFNWWLLTPNYNNLTFQSLTLIMIGLLLADKPGRQRHLWGWALVGIGGWLCFMAKPTTAVAIGLVAALYTVVLRRRSIPAMLGAAFGALCLLALTAVAVDGEVTGLVTRLTSSAATTALLGSGQDFSHLFRIDTISVGVVQLIIAILASVAFAALLRLGKRARPFAWFAFGLALIQIQVIVLTGYDLTMFEPSALFVLPLAAGLGVMAYRQGFVPRFQSPTGFALAMIFLVLPHLFALGTNNNYWLSGSLAALFWMLAAVAFLSPLARLGHGVTVLTAATVLAQLLTASMVNAGMQKPYRQEPNLRAAAAATQFPGRGELVLSRGFHDYLQAVTTGAGAAGFAPGAPAIDLTGRSPGILFALEARALGLPWLVGSYPGSDAVAIATLAQESCEDLAAAWILEEPDGPRALSEDSVLASFGASKATDYVVASSFETAPYAGGCPKSYRQNLLKPIRPEVASLQACLDTRQIQSDSQASRSQ